MNTRKKQKIRTHCRKGHKLTDDNLYIQIRPNGLRSRHCKICRYENQKRYNIINREQIRDDARKYRRVWDKKKRMECLTHYGKDGKLECVCCGEKTPEFLTLDHINNNGQIERKQHGNNFNIIMKLIKGGYPSGYQTLCWNCNLGKRSNKGICPHKTKTLLHA